MHFEDYIRTEIALCDFIQTKLRTPKRMMLSFDEFGSRQQEIAGSLPGRGTVWEHRFDPKREYARHDPGNMMSPTQFAQRGGMLDALTSASTFLTLLNHADRIKIGCMTWGLHSLAAVDGEHVWKPISHYPYTQLMRWGQGTALVTAVDCDSYDITPSIITSSTGQTGVPIQAAAAFNSVLRAERICHQQGLDGDRELELDIGALRAVTSKSMCSYPRRIST